MQVKPPAASSGGAVSLRVLIPFLVLLGAGLYQIVGPPHAPESPLALPDPSSLEALLRSSHPPLDGTIYVVGMLGWAIWAWLVLSLVLQLVVAVAEHVAEGEAAVRQARSLADVLSAPLVRRAVQTSLAGGMMARVALAGVPAAGAAPLEQPAVVIVESAQGATPISAAPQACASSEEATADLPHGCIVYLVRLGDNLARIAERFYGNGDKWPLIYEANQNRRMSDGRIFDRAGVIQPNWQLIIPEPTVLIETDASGQRWYIVRKGDSLASICARVLGDENRWPELYAANVGARLDDRHVLDDPRLIWPGLRLRLPGLDTTPASANDAAAAPTAPTPPVTEPSPVPAPPPATPSPTPSPAAQQEATPAAAAPMPTIAPPAATESSRPPEQAEPRGNPLETVQRDVPPWTAEAIGAAAGTALIGLGLAGARRRPRRRSPWDETDIQVIGGFAEAFGGDELAYEPQAAALADQVVASAREQGCSSLQLLGVYAGRTGAGLLLSVREQEVDQLTAAAAAFGLAPTSVRLKPTEHGDYHWEQAWSTVRPRPVATDQDAPPGLVPLGLAGDRRVLYAPSSAMGTVLVAGRATAGVHELLAALVLDAARRQWPDELYLVTIARPSRLVPLLAELPHQRAGYVQPDDAGRVAGVLDELRLELERRLRDGQGTSPDVVLVVDEWAELSEQGPVLDLLARHGPAVGIRIMAASTRVEDPEGEHWVGLFGTRLVLQTPDAASSMRLLGALDAHDLDAVGELSPSLQGRVLHPVRGFRVPPLHLADLVEQMRTRADAEHRWVAPALEHLFDFLAADDQTDHCSDQHGPSNPESAAPDPEPPAHAERGGMSAAAPAGSSVPESPATTTAGLAPTSPVETAVGQQLALIRAVPLSGGQTAAAADVAADVHQHVHGPPVPEPLVDLYLFGTRASLIRGQELSAQHNRAVSTYHRGWNLLMAIAALPPTRASMTMLGALLWPDDADDLDAVTNRIQSNLSNVRQILQAAGLSKSEARRVVRTEGGVCLLDGDRVRVDVWQFLDAQRAGNHARAAGKQAEAIAAYERARAVYVGPLLDRQAAVHAWVHERIADGLTLGESYHSQWCELTERLAELYQAAGRHADASALYRELLVDPLALPSRDRDVVEAREAHARALFACCRALGDAATLERAFEDLKQAVAQDDRQGGMRTPTKLSTATVDALSAARQELRRRVSAASSSADD